MNNIAKIRMAKYEEKEVIFMKYYSEVTKKIYDKKEDLAKAEEEHQKQLDEQEKLKAERATRAKEVEDAFKKAYELKDAFIKDYGAYHQTFYRVSDPFETLVDMLFD